MEYLIQDTTLQGIADAIRSKTGGTAQIAVPDMAAQIDSIQIKQVYITDGVITNIMPSATNVCVAESSYTMPDFEPDLIFMFHSGYCGDDWTFTGYAILDYRNCIHVVYPCSIASDKYVIYHDFTPNGSYQKKYSQSTYINSRSSQTIKLTNASQFPGTSVSGVISKLIAVKF